jgi:hypothetical protein
VCSELAELQRILADVMVDPQPDAALARAAQDAGPYQAQLAAADGDGVRMAALIVVRLRFERLLNGSPMGADWFERDPKGFAKAFKRYHAEVAPTAASPSEEARLFEAWSER